MTVEFAMSNNLTMINRLIIVLGRKFCLSHHQNTRKGGLLGLAAVMVGFKNGSISEPPLEMVEEVVRPILTCLLDSDSRVRYYACESLYNVVKVFKANVLSQFEPIFDSLTRAVADPDIGVKAGAETLDRILKDIVVEQTIFEVQDFVSRLEEYIYTKNPFTKMFIISWIRLLDSKIDMICHLPQLLDGMFNCLYDSTEEIRASTLVLLSEFLNKIVTRPTDQINMPSIVTTLIRHARNDREDPVQYTAIAWLRQFIRLMDSSDLLSFAPGILSAILPCLAARASDSGSNISVNDRQQATTSSQQYIPQTASQNNICEISTLVNSSLLEQVTMVLSDRRNASSNEPTMSDLEPILEVLGKELQTLDHPVIKLAILDWFNALKKAEPELILASLSQQKLFQTLLDTLAAPSGAVVKNALRVITEVFCDDSDEPSNALASNLEDSLNIGKEEEEIKALDGKKSPSRATHSLQTRSSGSGSKRVAIATNVSSSVVSQTNTPNIARFVTPLCKMFRDNETVFEDRGTFIIINLCSIIKPQIVYKSFAEILREERTDPKFAFNLVQKLNQILLTTQPLFGLRSRLGCDNDPEMTTLFHTLYYAWCHSPIATITLCLLTNNYRHANEIVVALSQTDINVDTLTQIDWIVQLIESPIFSSLRMRLLDVNNNQYLIQSLYGLLMILPQSEAYRKLSHRLDQVCKFMSAQPHFKTISSATSNKQGLACTTTGSSGSSGGAGGKEAKRTNSSSNVSLESLMKHFNNIQILRAKTTRTVDIED